MCRSKARSLILAFLTVGLVLLSGPVVKAAPADGSSAHIASAPASGGNYFRGYVQPYFYPSYGSFG
jgi:hypothetical protein